MCGRFTLTADISALQESFPWLGIPPGLEPRYNIAPTQPVAVVPNDGKNRLDFFTWGLIPSWAKDPSIGNRMINARAETLAEKPSFRSAFRRRRCLILADGFYEWSDDGGKSKTPMYIRLRSGALRLRRFVGDLERPGWLAGALLHHHHHRAESVNGEDPQPHAGHPAAAGARPLAAAGEADPKALAELLKPYPAEEMVAYPVSKLVNSPANDVPALIEPAG